MGCGEVATLQNNFFSFARDVFFHFLNWNLFFGIWMGRDPQNKFPDMFSPCLRDVLELF